MMDQINICAFVANFTFPSSTIIPLIGWFVVTSLPQLLQKVKGMESTDLVLLLSQKTDSKTKGGWVYKGYLCISSILLAVVSDS